MAGNWWESIENAASSAIRPSGPAQRGSGDLEALQGQYGGGTTQQTYETSTDPNVWMGFDLGRTGSPDAQESRAAVDRFLPYTQALSSIYAWSPANVEMFQRSLVRAGLVDEDKIRFRTRDAVTLTAWKAAVDAAAGATEAGLKRSPWEVVDEFESAAPAAGSGGGGGSRGPGRVQTNPEDVRALAESTAKAVIGRGVLTAEEQARFEGAFRTWEAPYLGHSDAAPPGQEATQAFAEEQIREIDPLKADARKVAGRADLFARMLRGDV